MDEKKMDTVSKKITFPIATWVEFESLAQRYYGDCYWLAISDCMNKARLIDSIGLIKVDINNLNERLQDLELRLADGNALTEVEEAVEDADDEEPLTLGENPIMVKKKKKGE